MVYDHKPWRMRRMGLQDLPFVVHSHSQHFAHGFFARLGPRFLTKYYRTFLDGPLAVAVVCEIDEAPIGYLVGILDTRRHRRLLLAHHGTTLAVAAALGMIARPWLAVTFLWTRCRRYVAAISRARHASGAADAPVHVAVLSHLVVLSEARCQGIGAALVDEFLRQAVEADCSRACLVTLAGDTGAGTFYQRRGWTHTHQGRSPEGRELAYYSCDLQ